MPSPRGWVVVGRARGGSSLMLTASSLPAAAFLTQSVCLDDTTVKFEIWDTAGQERYHSLAPMYYRGAQAAIVVYDITNQVRSSEHVCPRGGGGVHLGCSPGGNLTSPPPSAPRKHLHGQKHG